MNDFETGRFSDASLLERFQAGEGDAATALYTRYAERLLRIADRRTGDDLSTRIDAEDVVQSVFRTFFRRVSDGHYMIPQGEELWKLLLVIALNKVRSIAEHHRAAKRDVANTRALGDTEPTAAPDANEVLRMTIEDVLIRLPKAHQQIVHLRIDGYEIGEISEKVSISRRSVERILQSVRQRLQTTLTAND